MQDLVDNFHLSNSATGLVTSSVQLGFILGTLVFAILTIADRFSPSKVFFWSSLAAAACNVSVIYAGHSMAALLSLRLLTGFFLAGIYPVGMKISADHFGPSLGRALGFLVGALVLGTAFPHFIRSMGLHVAWTVVFVATTILVLAGGTLILLFVPDGPYRQKSAGFDASAIFSVFKSPVSRAPALGYFGHMWEVYTFWAFAPVMLAGYAALHPGVVINIPLWSFIVIGSGSVGCGIGGALSQRYGSRTIALVSLAISGVCCLLSPLAFYASFAGFVLFLLVWGLTVAPDSPMFSALVAQNTIAESKGTALTIVNCIGFAITIVSIQLLSMLMSAASIQYLFLLIVPGPAMGLWAMKGK